MLVHRQGRQRQRGHTNGKNPTEALAAAVHNISSGKAESFQLSLKPDDAAIAAMNKTSTSRTRRSPRRCWATAGSS